MLDVKVLDHDYMSQNATIGQVLLDLKPLFKAEVAQVHAF